MGDYATKLIFASNYAKLGPNVNINSLNPIIKGGSRTINLNKGLIFPPSPLDYSVNCLIIKNILKKPINFLVISNTGNSKFFFFSHVTMIPTILTRKFKDQKIH